jgi:hypothetical protein
MVGSTGICTTRARAQLDFEKHLVNRVHLLFLPLSEEPRQATAARTGGRARRPLPEELFRSGGPRRPRGVPRSSRWRKQGGT